jgi:hypothetical protein
MTQPTSVDLTARHCVLEVGEECVTIRRAILAELVAAGVAAPPTLVFDLVAAACEDGSVQSTSSGRDNAGGVARCMRRVAEAMSKVHGSVLTKREVRRRAAKALLASWFASVPPLDGRRESLQELELVALGLRPAGRERSARWIEWRRREELMMSDQGSPEFLRALAEIRAATPEGFAAIDERIWMLREGEATALHGLNVASKGKAGGDPELFRSHLGPFREVGNYGVPPDPSRLVASDLALLGAHMPEARAIVAAKIVDASLVVRFGSMPRPAARRPRVLLVAALEDDVDSHVQHEDLVAPAVEPLREALLHALPTCLRVLASLKVDFALEVRRDGPFVGGALHFSDLLNRQGRLALDFRTAPRLLARLAQDAPWLFADAPSRRRTLPPLRSAGFDASYLLAAGGRWLRDEGNWTGWVGIECVDHAMLRVVASGAMPGAGLEAFSVHEPQRAGVAAALAFGGDAGGEGDGDHVIGGTIFS